MGVFQTPNKQPLRVPPLNYAELTDEEFYGCYLGWWHRRKADPRSTETFFSRRIYRAIKPGDEQWDSESGYMTWVSEQANRVIEIATERFMFDKGRDIDRVLMEQAEHEKGRIDKSLDQLQRKEAGMFVPELW